MFHAGEGSSFYQPSAARYRPQWESACYPVEQAVLWRRLDKQIETVLERLAETIAWCSPRVDLNDPKGCLRTMCLRPNPLENGRIAVVESVARARYIALQRPEKRLASDLAGGRLLIYEPDMNLAHGLEEGETRGYVDIDNIPPWDTWVEYVTEQTANYLLSWVPGPFVPLVLDGIAVNPEECFRFLDDTDFELRERLKSCGVTANRQLRLSGESP